MRNWQEMVRSMGSGRSRVVLLTCLVVLVLLARQSADAGLLTDRWAQWKYLRQAQQAAEQTISPQSRATNPPPDSMLQRVKNHMVSKPTGAPKAFKMKTTPMKLGSGGLHR